MLWACIAALLGFALIGVHTWCEINCTRLDVETGRRDAGALIDDYGSNRGWYPRWKIPSILSALAGVTLWLFAVGACSLPGHARDLDGRHANSPLKPWFDSLKSGKGPCCSDADGYAVADPDWESKGGHYRVRIEGEWYDVPDDAVITVPNLYGKTMVWPIKGYGGLTIRCFMPGAMT